MGMHRQTARFILREHKYSPIRGRVLLIGRQTVLLTPKEMRALFAEEGVPLDPKVEIKLDKVTRAGADTGYVSDISFFQMLGVREISMIDVSDYEGADIIHNLDTPIPPSLEGKFDFIFNGSVFDNVFDPVTALKNTSRMLSPTGRIVHVESASNYTNNAYLQFSPNWFTDYYVVNSFADAKTYLALYNEINDNWSCYACHHGPGQCEPAPFPTARCALNLVIAEKKANSTWDRCPIQGQYRSPAGWKDYMANIKQFEASPRPWLVGGGTTMGLVSRLYYRLRRSKQRLHIVRDQLNARQRLFMVLDEYLPAWIFRSRRLAWRGYTYVGGW